MTVVCYVMVYLMRSMAALCAGRHTASNKNGNLSSPRTAIPRPFLTHRCCTDG